MRALKKLLGYYQKDFANYMQLGWDIYMQRIFQLEISSIWSRKMKFVLNFFIMIQRMVMD